MLCSEVRLVFAGLAQRRRLGAFSAAGLDCAKGSWLTSFQLEEKNISVGSGEHHLHLKPFAWGKSTAVTGWLLVSPPTLPRSCFLLESEKNFVPRKSFACSSHLLVSEELVLSLVSLAGRAGGGYRIPWWEGGGAVPPSCSHL